MWIAFVVAADPIAIVVADAGESDHLPSDHVAIAAVNGIGEESLGHVLQQRAEKGLRIDAIEFDVAGFKLLQRVVLLLGRKLIEGLAALVRLAILGECGKALAIELRRRQRRLWPLLFRPL